MRVSSFGTKHLLSSVSRKLIPLLVLTLLPSIAITTKSHANLVVDANNADFNFNKNNVTVFFAAGGSSNTLGEGGKASGDKVLFKSVFTAPGGLTLDALVTTTIVNTSTGSDPNKLPKINSYDQQTVSGAEKFLDLSVGANSGSTFNGYINLNFLFFDSSDTYTGPNTGTRVSLRNVSVYSLDVDSGVQFTDFRGFQRYYLNSGTEVQVNNSLRTNGVGTPPYVRFLSGPNAGGTNEPGTAVQVEYLSLESLDARVGNASDGGGAYFALGFGQWDWNGGQAGLGTPNPTNNPINAAPTSSNNSINVPSTGNFIIEKRHFGNYADEDGNLFDKVQIIALPSSGTLQKLQAGNWVNVAINEYINISSIDAGELRIAMSGTAGTSDTSFRFEVNDSLSDSLAAYTLTLNVVATPQSITFNNPGTRALNSTVTDTATASSGLPATLTSSTTGICTINGAGNIVNTGVAGACTVTAVQDGNSVYSAAASVTLTFYFSSNTLQTITYTTPTDKSLANGSYTDTATANSGLTVTLTSLTSGTCTVSGFVVTLVSAGTCQIRASQAGGTVGGTTYAPASPVTRSFNITSGTAQTITYAAPSDRSLSEVSYTDTATASSGLPVTLTSLTTSVCTVSGFVVTLLTGGTCQLRASQSGDSTYAAANPVTRSFVISSGTSQTITFAQPDSKFVGDSFASNATASSGLTVTLASGNANICTVSGLNITAVATGSCVITASQSGGTNNGTTFSAATNVSRTFTISDRPIVIPTNAIFFDANTGTGFMNSQYGVTGSLLTLDRNTLTKTGFRFVGWNLRADGSGISYRDGQAIALTSDIRLFAQWEFIRKTPTVTWADPAPINNKTPLSGVQLNATSATPGTYVYSPAAGTLLAPGKQKLKVVFTPTDIINFEPITLEVEITVIEQRLPVISWANPEEIIFGTLISATQLNASASVDGSFDYGNQSGLLLPVGTHTLTVNFKPKDALNFADIKATVSIVVLEKLEPKANILITPYQTTGESKVLGVNAGTTLVVLERGPGISSSRVNGDIVTVVPRPGFAGETSLKLRATLGKQVVEFDKTVKVLPATPSGATMRVVDSNNSQLDWNLVSSATKYEATLNGQILCTSDTSSCIANKLLGPKSDVKVVAIAAGELRSGEGDVQYLSPESPVIAKIENFATASFRLNAKAKRELREFAAEVRELGFTRLQVQGHTDIRGGVDNTVLSRNRAQQTIKFLQRLLPEVQFKVGYFASTRPLADNSTREGLAANRRVEIAIW